MKKMLLGLMAAGAIGTTQAQTKPDIQCSDTQVKVVSALALAQGGNGVIDCKEVTPTSHVLLADAGTVSVRSPSVALDKDGKSPYNENQFSVTPFASTHGTGLAGTAVVGGKDRAVGLRADGTSKMKHGTVGVATRVGDSATVSVTGSVAHEDAGIALGNKDYDGKTLKGEQVMVGLDGANVGLFKTAGISLGVGKTHATELGSNTTITTENRIVDTPTATENWRDTYSTKTTTNYSGSTWNRVGVRGVLDVGTQGELSLRGGAYRNNIIGNTATGGVGYTHYMGTAGKFELGADVVGDTKLYSAKYTKPLSEGWALTAGVNHLAGVINDTKAMVGLVWTPGAKSSYSRPTAYGALDANKIVARNLSSAENDLRGLGSYGKVETTTGPKTLTGSEKTGETAKAPTGPALADVTVGDNGGDPISFNLNALAGLPAGSTVVSVTGFPTVDDYGDPTNFSCSNTGICTATFDIGNIGYLAVITLPVSVEVQVPGFTQRLIRSQNIKLINE